MNTQNISRRTLARGAAWSVPAVAVAASAPALAASPANSYEALGGGYSEVTFNRTGCDAGGEFGGRLTSISFDSNFGNGYPDGFAVVELNGSDTTTATLSQPLELVIAYPEGMVDTSQPNNGFTETTNSLWSGPTLQTTTINGVSMDVFTFTYTGSLSQQTVANGNPPLPWDGTTIAGTFAPNPNYCYPYSGEQAFGGYASGDTLTGQGTYTTANGQQGNLPPNGFFAIQTA